MKSGKTYCRTRTAAVALPCVTSRRRPEIASDVASGNSPEAAPDWEAPPAFDAQPLTPLCGRTLIEGPVVDRYYLMCDSCLPYDHAPGMGEIFPDPVPFARQESLATRKDRCQTRSHVK